MNRSLILAALKRAAHTAAQVAVGGIGTATLIEQVPWTAVLSMTILAAILSLLKSIAVGTPETGVDALKSAAESVVGLNRAEAPEDVMQAAVDHLGAQVGK